MDIKTLETDRLILRPFKATDAPLMYKNWGSDETTTKYLSWPTHTSIDTSRSVIDFWLGEYAENKGSTWAIELKELGEPIGSISIVASDENIKCHEVGYCIGSIFFNKGYTTEAFKKIINYIFTSTDTNRIIARHNIKNPASGQVMKKCGLSYEGTLRDGYLCKETLCDISLYAILKNDFLTVN